jgi:hypothetical protein
MNAFNIVFASIALAMTFYCGMQFREYQMKADMCQGVATIAANFGTELAAGHPCRPYI